MDATGFQFWHRQHVRYRDVDMQHIVYYGKYLEYFDIATFEYFRALGVVISETAASGEFDTATVHVSVDYSASALFDDFILVGVRIDRLGRTSFDVALEIRREADGELLCRGTLTLVNYDRRTRRAQPIPARVRQAITEFEDRPI